MRRNVEEEKRLWSYWYFNRSRFVMHDVVSVLQAFPVIKLVGRKEVLAFIFV